MFLSVLLGGLIAACSPQQQTLQLDAPWDESMPVFSPNTGFLTIHLATREERVFSDDPADGKLRFEPYVIYNQEGKKVRAVSVSFYEPQTITLAPGKYVIVTTYSDERFKKFGVIIESGKTTVVEDRSR